MRASVPHFLSFFMGITVWIDILSYPSTSSRPIFTEKHRHFLAGEHSFIQLNRVMACDNGVVGLIFDIVLLDERKKSEKPEGTLSLRALLETSTPIEARPHQQLDRISEDISSSHTLKTLKQPEYDRLLITYIFACSALVYLQAVISGPHPMVREVRESLSKSIEAFRLLPDPTYLRCLVWPFCIVGCMAAEEEQSFFFAILYQLKAPKSTHWGMCAKLSRYWRTVGMHNRLPVRCHILPTGLAA
jgi:C6 transcription factor Pro1